MADPKIVDLAQLADASVASGDWLVVYDASTGATYKLSVSVLSGLYNASWVAGDILYYNGTNFVRLAKGTAGQLLRMNSGATAPEWGVSGLTRLASLDLSSTANADFTEFDATKYDAYRFVLQAVKSSNATSDVLMFRTSTDGGSTYDSGASDYSWQYSQGSGGNSNNNDNAIDIGASLTSGQGLSGTVELIGPHLTAYTSVVFNTYGESVNKVGGGERKSAADVDAVRFAFTLGTLESGTITMYGLLGA